MNSVNRALAAALCTLLLALQTQAFGADAPGITIPAGTVIPVRMIDSIDSSQNHAGQEFRALRYTSGDKTRSGSRRG